MERNDHGSKCWRTFYDGLQIEFLCTWMTHGSSTLVYPRHISCRADKSRKESHSSKNAKRGLSLYFAPRLSSNSVATRTLFKTILGPRTLRYKISESVYPNINMLIIRSYGIVEDILQSLPHCINVFSAPLAGTWRIWPMIGSPGGPGGNGWELRVLGRSQKTQRERPRIAVPTITECVTMSDEVLSFLKRLVLKMRDKEVFGEARWLSAYVFPEGCRIEADTNWNHE